MIRRMYPKYQRSGVTAATLGKYSTRWDFHSKKSHSVGVDRFRLYQRIRSRTSRKWTWQSFSSLVPQNEEPKINHTTAKQTEEGSFILSSTISSPYDDLHRDEKGIHEINDPLTSFLDSFAETIKHDVNDIISKMDVRRVRIRKADDDKSDKEAENETKENCENLNSPQRKGILRRRWERIFRKESRRSVLGSGTTIFKNKRRSVEDLWDESLRSIGYCIHRSLSETQPGLADKIYVPNQGNDIRSNDPVSPVFRLQMNDESYLVDIESDMLQKRDHESNAVLDDFAFEIRPFLWNTSLDTNDQRGHLESLNHNAILRSISLLIAMRPKDWRLLDSSVSIDTETNAEHLLNVAESDDMSNDASVMEDENPEAELGCNKAENSAAGVENFLAYIKEAKVNLTTPTVNLLLAHIVASTEIENSLAGDYCSRIFEEMKTLSSSGKEACGPDSTTYRILILAFGRRLQAPGKAVMIAEEMMNDPSVVISSEVMNEALRACHIAMELSVAKAIVDLALVQHRTRMNLESCILYTEMLKASKLDQDATKFFRDIQDTKLLTKPEEDTYLISLCKWPKRSRRGDILDLFSFWTEILSILRERTSSIAKPDIRVWVTFLERIYSAAKSDDSLWKLVGESTRIVLMSYPSSFVGEKLMTVGLDASTYTSDPELASIILKRVAEDSRTSSVSIVPFRAVKNVLEICLRRSDASNARSIQESLHQLGSQYPLGAKFELDSLVLLCHTKVNDVESAKHDLQSMIENGMKPSEDLYCAVLHSMAVAERYHEMEELFQSMFVGPDDGCGPGVSAYDAILLGRIRSGSWDKAIDLFEEMKSKAILPSPRTVQGILLATDRKGGKEAVLSMLESLLQNEVEFDESAFQLASSILLDGVMKDPGLFRSSLRSIGEKNKEVKAHALNLIRSMRYAEIESSRPKSAHKSELERKQIEKEAWRLAMSHLVEFAEAWPEADGEFMK